MFNLTLKTRFPSDISRLTSTTTRTEGKNYNALHTVALFSRFAQPTCSLRDARPACPVHAFQILLPYIYLPFSSQQCLKKKTTTKNWSDLKIVRHEVVNILSKLPDCLYLSYSCAMLDHVHKGLFRSGKISTRTVT